MSVDFWQVPTTNTLTLKAHGAPIAASGAVQRHKLICNIIEMACEVTILSVACPTVRVLCGHSTLIRHRIVSTGQLGKCIKHLQMHVGFELIMDQAVKVVFERIVCVE